MRGMIVFGLVALAAPAHADDDLDIPGLDAPDLRGDALVWEDATFFLEPWDNGLSVRISSIGRRNDEVGRAIPVRIVDSSMRRFVELELPDRLDCAWRRWQPDKRVEALRVYVKREDLAPVLVKPFAMTGTDGTALKLQPGVPVTPTTSGAYMISLRGDKLRVPIPHGSVGYVYTSTKVVEPDIPGTSPKVYRVDRNVAVHVLGEEMQLRSYNANWLSPEPTHNHDQAQLHWATRCVDAIVEAPNNVVRPMDRPKPVVPVKPIDTPLRPTGYYIPTGAPLATPSGREVGVAARPIPVGAPSGDTSCFDAELAAAKIDDQSYPARLSRFYRVCAPARLVERDN